MRFVGLTCLLFTLAACTPVREFPPPPAVVQDAAPAAAPASVPRPLLASYPVEAPRATGGGFSGITFEGVSFDARRHRLAVVDQPKGPGSRFADAAAAGQSVGGIAAVNGGFFTPAGEPLGLVIAGGKRSGSWNSSSSLGSGVWHVDAAGDGAISRREKLGPSRAGGMRGLLQAGPMLVANGLAVSGLDPLKTSARTIILWDSGNRWWIGRCTPATLAQVAAVLAENAVPGWPVRHALNLDGGRSSNLWISNQVPGGPLARRPAWNRPVRNFLVLLPTS